MNYTTTVTLGVEVKGGPPGIAQKSELEGVEAASSRRYIVEKDDCVTIQPPLGDDQILFYVLSVEGNRYTYKDCGVDKPGIAININTNAGKNNWYWIKEAQVFIWRPGQPLADFKTIRVKAASEMFDSPQCEPAPITVTVTYGVGTPPTGTPPGEGELAGCVATAAAE